MIIEYDFWVFLSVYNYFNDGFQHIRASTLSFLYIVNMLNNLHKAYYDIIFNLIIYVWFSALFLTGNVSLLLFRSKKNL